MYTRENLHSRSLHVMSEHDYKELKAIEARVNGFVAPEHDPMIDMIYVMDEFTCAPAGDLVLMLGANVNPEVRDYITKNLMRDNGASVLAPSFPSTGDESITDDTIALLTRSDTESRQSYVQRVNAYMKENIANEKARLDLEKIRSSYKDRK